jgi:sterol desaturase/sphingolipid hydroxylase (fatty acid hydroxylase superfamily)
MGLRAFWSPGQWISCAALGYRDEASRAREVKCIYRWPQRTPNPLSNQMSLTCILIEYFISIAGTAHLGGGLVTLPSSGWGLVPAVALYAVTMDFGEYVFHRAQHRFPVLWAMHPLQHSDRAVNVSTTQRHFWAEQAIKSATIYLMVGLLFRTSDRILVIYGVLTF